MFLQNIKGNNYSANEGDWNNDLSICHLLQVKKKKKEINSHRGGRKKRVSTAVNPDTEI